MTHVVTAACIKCKYTDCVEVCPTHCFHEGENMLVINPENCIDCGLCVPACPIGSIVPETAAGAPQWIEINLNDAQKWPVIKHPKAPLPDADAWKDIPDKFKNYFSATPAK